MRLEQVMINPLDVRELRLDQKDLSELPDDIRKELEISDRLEL